MAGGRWPDPGSGRALLRAALIAWLALAAHGHAFEPDSELARQLQAERRQRMESIIARNSEQIEAGAMEGRELAAAFRARGVARRALTQYGEALADLSQAVALDPFSAQNYEERARTYLRLRELAAAEADLDMALGLEPKRWSAERDKGRLAAYQGDFYRAWAQFQRAWRLADEQASVYNALWLDIAMRRAGGAGTPLLDEWLEQFQPDQWPAPVYRMLRGTLSPEDAIAAAAAADPRKSLQQRCEANFYAGQVYLMRGEPEQARAAFEAAVATGITEYMEYDWALRELELMGQRP